MSSPRRHQQRRLLTAIAGRDGSGVAPMPLRGGAIVTAVDKTVTPWTVDLSLPDGGTVADAPCVGWYDPTVNDVVMVGVVDRAVVCLGGYAGASKVVATTTTTQTPTTPTAPEPDETPVTTTTTKYVSPTAGRTWAPDQGGWYYIPGDLRQGGISARRAFLFYGTRIATAKGSGKIVAGTIYIKRASSGGVYGDANLYLGTHTYESQPSSGATSHANEVRWAFALNESRTLRLSAAQIAALNAGTAKGFGFEPNALGWTSPDYFVSYPYGSSYPIGQLALTIETTA